MPRARACASPWGPCCCWVRGGVAACGALGARAAPTARRPHARPSLSPHPPAVPGTPARLTPSDDELARAGSLASLAEAPRSTPPPTPALAAALARSMAVVRVAREAPIPVETRAVAAAAAAAPPPPPPTPTLPPPPPPPPPSPPTLSSDDAALAALKERAFGSPSSQSADALGRHGRAAPSPSGVALLVAVAVMAALAVAGAVCAWKRVGGGGRGGGAGGEAAKPTEVQLSPTPQPFPPERPFREIEIRAAGAPPPLRFGAVHATARAAGPSTPRARKLTPRGGGGS